MRQFLMPRAPLKRGTLLFCHLMLQLGLLTAAGYWLAPRTPWLADTSWQTAWPMLALGAGLWLLASMLMRLVLELALLPHHLTGIRPGFRTGDVVTRSYERRPAVHDEERAWTSQARPMSMVEEGVGEARVTQPASRPRGAGLTQRDRPD